MAEQQLNNSSAEAEVEETEELVVKFTKFDEETLKEFSANLEHDKELEKNSGNDASSPEDYKFELGPSVLSPLANVDISELSYEDKTRFLGLCLKSDCINNAKIISNLVILAQGKLIEEDLYKSDDIFFEDDIEFLDLCTDLREEILDFDKNIVNYFLGALKSLSSMITEDAVHVPNLYFNALSSYTLNTISSAMKKVSLNYDEIPTVFNADVIIDRSCLKKNFMDEFMSELVTTLTADVE